MCLMLMTALACGTVLSDPWTGQVPQNGWLADGFVPHGFVDSQIVFVTSDRWDDFVYYVPVQDVIVALEAGHFNCTPARADTRCQVIHELERYNKYAEERGWGWVYFEGAELPTTFSGWNSMGVALYERGKYEEALQAFNETIRLNPELAAAWSNKGNTLFNLGEYEEAIRAFDEAIRLYPENPVAWSSKGLLNPFSRAAKVSATWSNKGNTLYYQGKYDGAIRAFDEAIRLYPENTIAWSSKAVVLEAAGRTSEANVAYAESQRLQ